MEKYFIVRQYGYGLKVFDIKTETKQFLDYLVQVGGPPNDKNKKIMGDIMDGNLEIFNKERDFYGCLFARINKAAVYLAPGT